jgi:hypothetical protein
MRCVLPHLDPSTTHGMDTLAAARCMHARGGGSDAQPGACPSSIFLDKNRGDIGKSQPKWTASTMETPGAAGCALSVSPTR